jgi:Senescence-associated protein
MSFSVAEVLCTVSKARVSIIENDYIRRICEGELLILSTENVNSSNSTNECETMLTVSNFSYPLINQPVLQSNSTTFVFPHVSNTQLVIEIDANNINEFKDVISNYVQLKTQEDVDKLHQVVKEQSNDDLANRLSRGLISGASITASGIVHSAQFAATSIRRLSQSIKEMSSSTPLVQTPKPPILRTDSTSSTSTHFYQMIPRTAEMSHKLVQISTSIVKDTSALAISLGTSLGEYILTTDVGKRLSQGSKTPTGRAVTLGAASSIVAAALIYEGLEKGAQLFMKESSEAAKDVLDHTYGPHASQSAKHVIDIVTNVAATTAAMRSVAIKSIVKSAASETAKHILVHLDDEGKKLQSSIQDQNQKK